MIQYFVSDNKTIYIQLMYISLTVKATLKQYLPIKSDFYFKKCGYFNSGKIRSFIGHFPKLRKQLQIHIIYEAEINGIKPNKARVSVGCLI